MKHINLDTQDERVRQFVLGLQLDSQGSILEINGQPVARVLPAGERDPDHSERLKQAILNRRDESRALNDEWEHADQEVWNGE